MSFLSRIKDLGKTQGDEEVQSEALSTEGMVTQAGSQAVDTQSSPSTIQAGATTTVSIDLTTAMSCDTAALADVRAIYVWFSGGGAFDVDYLRAE